MGYLKEKKMPDETPLRRLQLVELELFKKFSAFCDAHDITYYAIGGTLIGAVRHEGFIPWDDDMDIGVPREDYDRLLELCEREETPFELHSFRNDPDHYRFFAQIIDRSFRITRYDKKVPEEGYAWIDIFPLDGMPANRFGRWLWECYLLSIRMCYRFSLFDTAVDINKKGRPFYERALISLGKVLPVKRMFNTRKELARMDRAVRRFPYGTSLYTNNILGVRKFREVFPKSYYGSGRWFRFEDTKMFGPEKYDPILRQLYGDYMSLPPEEERDHHKLVIVDDR